MKPAIVGTSNRVLIVDLTRFAFEVYQVTEQERRHFLGGKGLGLKLLYDRMAPGIDPLSPENWIALMPGILMGTGAPCSGRFASVTKSPLTGIMTTSSCGGSFGMQLKTAGWDGLLLTGKAAQPTTLVVTKDGVEFRDAAGLWGKTVSEAQALLGKEGGSLVIGPAGENLVRFANILSGERYVGRGGQGAVMGSKNLKAVVAVGGHFSIVAKEAKAFAKAKRAGFSFIKQNQVTGDWYRNHGTPANVRLCNEGGLLPVNNFTKGMSAEADELSGEQMRIRNETKPHTCKPCAILCGKKGLFGGKPLVAPEYETVALFGSNLGIFDVTKVAEWNKLCGEVGIDTISAGNVIGWAMEATEKGLLESNLKFGSGEEIEATIWDIALRRGLGDDLAQGVRALAERYGGREFAMHVKGLELPGYDPRGSFGQGLSYATANRGGCHLSTAVFTMEVFFGLLKPYKTGAKAHFVRLLEDVNCCVNSMHVCQFTAYAYLLEVPMTRLTPKPILAFLMQNLPGLAVRLVDFGLYRRLWSSVLGLRVSSHDFITAGTRIHVLERYMNTREGISKKDDTLPPRLLQEGRECDPEQRTVPLEPLLEQYYQLRGFDADGVPTAATLSKLGLASSSS